MSWPRAHQLPVIFHTGDTYSAEAKLKYAHPLRVDEVAVDHRGVRFVLAHFGNPWLFDAAEVTYKNPNVFVDLSGLLVGSAADFAAYGEKGVLDDVVTGLARAIRYTEAPGRILYGSDWPLAPMTVYRDLIRRMVPDDHREAVFETNARALFGI